AGCTAVSDASGGGVCCARGDDAAASAMHSPTSVRRMAVIISLPDPQRRQVLRLLFGIDDREARRRSRDRLEELRVGPIRRELVWDRRDEVLAGWNVADGVRAVLGRSHA